MNTHALAVLEFPRVLALVADRASSELGAARVRSFTPSSDIGALEREHARVAALRAMVGDEGGWRPEAIPSIEPALDRLRIVGAPWSGVEALGALVLLRSSRRTRAALTDQRRTGIATAVLAPFASRLLEDKSAEARIEKAIGDDGTVRDDASPALRSLRRELRGAQGELIKLLERVMAGLAERHGVSDMSVTVRNGRYVIPIRREGRGDVGGIVHDTSATGATLFIEPPAAVEFGNRIRELEAEESREVHRVLLELTEGLRPLRDGLIDALDALVSLDTLYARARFADEFACAPAELCSPRDGFSVRDARHPLLVAQGIPVVPFDLTMLPDERTLLVSGPNTGGKTVLLKAVGLLSAMMQSGIPAPVGSESRIAVFDDAFADVGDEQSIQASLSTFSAHVKNLSEILRFATDRSIVLTDELGSGTDPLEGAALGGAILEELTRRGTFTIATTHLGALKELATEVPGIINASLQFDSAELAPTYRLIKGIPGRSYGIGIARRLGLPEQVLTRAEERLPAGERDVERLLADLERREAELSALETEARAMREESRERTAGVIAREHAVRDREKEVERQSREEARRYVLEARAEIERTIKALKQAGTGELDEAARAARQGAERLIAEQRRAVAEIDARDAEQGRGGRRGAFALAPGDMVAVATLGGKIGRLIDVRDDDGIVAVGVMKLTVPLAELSRSRQAAQPVERAATLVGDMPEVYAPSEIDLRGLRVDEMESTLMSALDNAVRADLKTVRIIHGKGTGALRERVTELLRKESRVKAFRLGMWNEGGAGVTVAEIA